MRSATCKTVIISLALVLAISSLTAISPAARAYQTVDTFSDATQTKTITFPEGGGTGSPSASVMIPEGMSVINATIQLTLLQYSLNGVYQYPLNLTLNVGDDSITGWNFIGLGYGALGHQTVFSDGSSQASLFISPEFQRHLYVKLPTSANITSATFKVANDPTYTKAYNFSIMIGTETILHLNGTGNFSTTTPDFSVALQEYLDALTQPPGTPMRNHHRQFEDEIDTYDQVTPQSGYTIHDVPFIISPGSGEEIFLSELSITYEFTAELSLASSLNVFLAKATPVGGVIEVPLRFSAESAGRILISDINIFLGSPPELVQELPDETIPEGGSSYHLYNLTLYFEDDAGEEFLSYELISHEPFKPIEGSIDGCWLDFYTQDPDWFGTANFTVIAIDRDGLRNESNVFTITVTPANDPPVYLGGLELLLIEVYEDTTWSVCLDNYFYDPDLGDTLSFKCNTNAIIIDNITHNASWSPKEGASDLINVTFTATDPQGASATSTPIDLIFVPVNDPPVAELISPKEGQTFTVGDKIHFEAQAEDIDSTELFYNWSYQLGNATPVPLSTELSFDRAFDTPGEYKILFIVRDDKWGSSPRLSVNITICKKPVEEDLLPGLGKIGEALTTILLIPIIIIIVVIVAAGLLMRARMKAGKPLLPARAKVKPKPPVKEEKVEVRPKPPVPEEEEIKCVSCGTMNAPGSVFCGECGASLKPKPEVEEEVVEKRQCPYCDTIVAPGVTECPECGGEIPS